MGANDIDPSNQVAIVNGRDFNPREFGYPDHIPASDQFVFYFIKKDVSLKRHYRLFECHYCDTEGTQQCNTTFKGISKFFSHLRVHTKEKPFKCTYSNCGLTFG